MDDSSCDLRVRLGTESVMIRPSIRTARAQDTDLDVATDVLAWPTVAAVRASMAEERTEKDRRELIETIHYDWLHGSRASQDLLEDCARLYSDHYGFWSNTDPEKRCGHVRFSADRLRMLVSDRDARIALARRESGTLVGYACAIQTTVNGFGRFSWVTQFVVHEDFQNRGVGRTLLHSIWGFSNHVAWGLASANPYAVRALEKATRRRCDPTRIKRDAHTLLAVGARCIPYIKDSMKLKISERGSSIDTRFFVDHSAVPTRIKNASNSGVPWLLGELEEGQEWFAFTFHDQKQFPLSDEELNRMLAASDEVVRNAYGRMSLDPSLHKWMRYAEQEVDFAIESCGLTKGASVLDVGCGSGRHALALASRDIEVVGIDYVQALADAAVEEARKLRLSRARFVAADCRTVGLGREFDAALCLYDVIGTYVDLESNLAILRSISRHLKPGGYALLSVMNMEFTQARATYRFSLKAEPDKLLDLPASPTMETTGDVFDPNYYMIDSDSGAVYRKEQFSLGSSLPAELVVRDRRFTKDDIEFMCRECGFDVIWSRFVRVGKWNAARTAEDATSCKEILVLCRKPETGAM